MKSFLILIAVVGAIALSGCAHTSSHSGHVMKCGMCECKLGKADRQDALHCASCHHLMTDHKNTPVPTDEHKH
ncbi:MAG TPA: hypothetical protein VK968_05490 [Roseimicrobium sp.]|nr:hypothetical protein [Roseimicrobium sp.]